MVKKIVYGIVAIAALQGALQASFEGLLENVKYMYGWPTACTAKVVDTVYSTVENLCGPQRPDADTVAMCSLPAWFGHAAYGQRKHHKRYNQALQESVSNGTKVVTEQPKLVKAKRKFSIWHPIQSMRTGKPKWCLPTLGPLLAAHATGITYYRLIHRLDDVKDEVVPKESVEKTSFQKLKNLLGLCIREKIDNARQTSLQNYNN